MADKMIVRAASTKLLIDGEDFPVVSYALSIAVNGLPQLSLGIPMGFAMTADGMGSAPVNVSAIKEGSEVLFNGSVGDMQVVFEGVVKRSGLDVRISSVSDSQGVYTVSAESSLSALGGMPTRDRIFMGNGVIPQNSIDMYRDNYLKLSTDKSDMVLTRLIDGSTLVGGYEAEMTAVGCGNFPELILKVLELLYKSESDKSAGRRGNNTSALQQIGVLRQNIIGGVLKKNLRAVEGRERIVRAMLEGLVKAWASSNGLDILVRALNGIFFAIVPKQDGMNYLQPYCPVYNKEKYTIPNSDILSIQKTDTYNVNPITGIRMRLPNDKFFQKDLQKGSSMYITYPEKGPGGLYKYVDGGTFDMWLSFVSAYDPQKEKRGKKGVQHTGDPNGSTKSEAITKGDKKAIETEEQSRTAIKVAVGKAVYALEKWKNNGIVIQVAWSPDINPGDIVKIDLTKNTGALADGIPLGVYYGYVHALQLHGKEGSINMSISLSHIRNEKDNKEYGFEEYPMYETPKEK